METGQRGAIVRDVRDLCDLYDVSLRYYQSLLVPGLLQTAAYAQAILEVWEPRRAKERVAELLEVNLKRQQLLYSDPPLKVWLILDGTVLHRRVGGLSVVAKQLGRLIQLTTAAVVTIEIIAYDAGAHVAMDGTFNILDLVTVPSVVYVEGLVGWIYLERSEDIDRYQQVFDRLLTQTLSPQESTADANPESTRVDCSLCGEYQVST